MSNIVKLSQEQLHNFEMSLYRLSIVGSTIYELCLLAEIYYKDIENDIQKAKLKKQIKKLDTYLLCHTRTIISCADRSLCI